MHKVGHVCTRIATMSGFFRLPTNAAVHEFSQIALATLRHTAWQEILGSWSGYKFMEKFILVRHLPVMMALALWGPALGGDDHREVLRKLLPWTSASLG